MTLDDSPECAEKTWAHGVRQVGSVVTEILVFVNTPAGVRSFTVSEGHVKLTEWVNLGNFHVETVAWVVSASIHYGMLYEFHGPIAGREFDAPCAESHENQSKRSSSHWNLPPLRLRTEDVSDSRSSRQGDK